MLTVSGTILRKVYKETPKGKTLIDLVLFDKDHSSESIKVTGQEDKLDQLEEGDYATIAVGASEYNGNVQYFANDILSSKVPA